MTDLTDDGRRAIAEIAGRYGLPDHAVEQMARAVSIGGGTMAQFNIPELGGSGQWMSGGMTMVGNMFDYGLQARVSNLCGELSNLMAQTQLFRAPQTVAGTAWWPGDLGQPASVGGQNQVRYAYFPMSRRIAFDPGNGAPVILLDTLDHSIGGWSQQQSGPGDPFVGITFSSQYGQFALSSLPRIGGDPAPSFAPEPAPMPAPQEFAPQAFAPAPEPRQPVPGMAEGGAEGGTDILGTIERLAKLRDAGALSEEEFSAKKAELLARL